MNVKEGWNPLCKFLEQDVPAWDFPKVNTGEQWEVNVGGMYQNINKAVYWNAAKTLGPAMVGIAAVAGFYLLRSGSFEA